ncbi:primosomal replication protein N [Chitinibacteraceae bacterium HSL-7]
MARNRVALEGQLTSLPPLRYSPAGIPIQTATLSHRSEQQENGSTRQVMLDASMMAVGEIGIEFGKLEIGSHIVVAGFLAGASQRFPGKLVLHIDAFKLLD